MTAPKSLIQSIGLLKACRIDVQHGIDRRPLLVVSVDAIQILLDQVVAGRRTRLHRFVNVSDGRFHQMERAIRHAVSAWNQQKSKEECNLFYAHESSSFLKSEFRLNTIENGFRLRCGF